MIYLQTVYSRRDPISVGLQNAFHPAFELPEAMANALLRLDARERRAKAPLVVRTRRHARELTAPAAIA